MSAAGSIGARLDLTVRAGDTLGPFAMQLQNATDSTPINLTGFTFEGAVSQLDTEDGLVPLIVAITDAVNGWIRFSLIDTTALENSDSDFFKAANAYSYYVKGTDTDGNKQTYLYGYVSVAKKEPT